MQLTWYGTGTILFSAGNKNILFDPFISMNPKAGSFDHLAAKNIRDIMITHGHFDHLVNVPELVRNEERTVYCSQESANTLQGEGVAPHMVKMIKPADSLQLDPFKIRVLKGKHIEFDLELIADTIINRRMVKYFGNFLKIGRLNRKYIKGEVLAFDIEANGKRVLHLGSLDIDEEEHYPQGVDLLTIPFQGRSDIEECALYIVEELKPKAVFMHHFDDTFPPISRFVDYRGFVRAMESKFPSIEVIVPDYREPVTI